MPPVGRRDAERQWNGENHANAVATDLQAVLVAVHSVGDPVDEQIGHAVIRAVFGTALE